MAGVPDVDVPVARLIALSGVVQGHHHRYGCHNGLSETHAFLPQVACLDHARHDPDPLAGAGCC
eukprot:353615-Chlamydomonas_euryale.AAC.15